MSQIENKGKEPFRNKEVLKPFLTCVDHSVSRETFSLFLDPETDLLVTLPRPSVADLPAYYESEAYISHTDSKRSLMDKVYQFIKSYSLKRKLKLINSLTKHKGKILDIGCGTGDLLSVCEKDGWDIFGVEPSQKAVDRARTKVNSAERIVTDLGSLEKNASFDVITMFHVLEHVPNLMEYIESLKSLLSSDGHLIVAVPNFKSYDAIHYKEFWAAYDVPRHLWHFSEKSIRHIFGQVGFEVVLIKPLIFDSFYVSLLSEKYKTGSSNVVSGFRTGLTSNMKARKTGQYSSLIYLIKKR
jgi:SAM-dependent methyltransferase